MAAKQSGVSRMQASRPYARGLGLDLMRPRTGKQFLLLAIDLSPRNGIGNYSVQFQAGIERIWSSGSCQVIARSASDDLKRQPSVHVPRTRTGYIFLTLRTICMLRPSEIVALHVSLIPVAWLTARLTGARITVVAHGWEVERPRGGIIARLLASKVHRFIAVSRHTALHAQMYPYKPLRSTEQIRILPPTVDSSLYHPDPEAGQRFRREFGYTDDDRIIVTVGRLDSRERGKGHENVIRALSVLQRTHPRLRYLVIGDGDDGERLLRLARQYGVDNAVRLAGFYANLRGVYSGADIFAMPSVQEGFGIVYVEALACGLPVVVGGVDGSVSAVLWGELGYICDPLDVESVRNAIEASLTSNAQDPRQNSEFLRSRSTEAFGHDAFDARLGDLFR